MFEIHVGELRATFLRNHNMRHHKDPKQKTTQADNSSPEDPHNPDSHHKHGGAAPDKGHCTRTEEVHCLRIGCSAPTHKTKRGTGTPNHSPPPPPCATGPYWRQDGHAAHATTCTPAHSGPIRHLLHPYMQRARLPSPSHAEKGVGPGVSSGAHPQSVRIRPASRRQCARGTWPAAR